MSNKTVYQGEPYPHPTERFVLRYWKPGEPTNVTHGNGWHSLPDAIAQARAFQNAGWYVQVVDTQAGGD